MLLNFYNPPMNNKFPVKIDTEDIQGRTLFQSRYAHIAIKVIYRLMTFSL